MRRDTMPGAVNWWIDLAKGLLAKQLQLPSISDSEIDMHAGIWEARESGDDDSLRAGNQTITRFARAIPIQVVAGEQGCCRQRRQCRKFGEG